MYANITAFLTRAKASGLRYPKVRLTAGGRPLVLSLAGERARYPGSVNMTDGRPYGDNLWYGRIVGGEPSFSFSATPEVKRVIEALASNPAATIAAYGKRVGVCACCGRELTDARSVSVGYGPVCAANWGLPWGEVDPAVAEAQQFDGTLDPAEDAAAIANAERYEPAY